MGDAVSCPQAPMVKRRFRYSLVISSFMTYQQVCNKSNTAGVTSGGGTACTSEAPELTPSF